MKSSCYQNGICDKCGCTTIALQMANKTCGGACYPEMMNWTDWDNFKNDLYSVHDSNGMWTWVQANNQLINNNKGIIRVLTTNDLKHGME